MIDAPITQFEKDARRLLDFSVLLLLGAVILGIGLLNEHSVTPWIGGGLILVSFPALAISAYRIF